METPSAIEQRYELFVNHFLADPNATRAAIAIGTPVAGAHVAGHRLLKNPKVMRMLAERRGVIADRFELSAEYVVRELMKLASSNMAEYIAFDADGDPVIDLSDLTHDQWAAVQEVITETYTEGRGPHEREVRRVKIKLYSKDSALDKLAKHLGLFKREKDEDDDKSNAQQVHYTLQIGNATFGVSKADDIPANPLLEFTKAKGQAEGKAPVFVSEAE